MRCADGPAAEDHLAAGADVDERAVFQQPQAGGAVARGGPRAVTLRRADVVVHQDRDGLGAGVDGEVGPARDRVQERIRHRPAPAASLVDVEVRAAGVVAAVELLDRGDAGLGGGGLPGVEDLPAHPRAFDADLTVGAVPLVGAAEVVLQLLVDGQCLPTPAPPVVAGGLRPQVVVAGLAAHVDHGVDRRTAADDAAARVADAAPGQARVGFGGKAPVGAGVGDGVEVAHRHLDPEPVVVAAGLDQQHPVIRVGAEPVGQQAARTARADDDEVELGGWAHGDDPAESAGRSGSRYCLTTLKESSTAEAASRSLLPSGNTAAQISAMDVGPSAMIADRNLTSFPSLSLPIPASCAPG